MLQLTACSSYSCKHRRPSVAGTPSSPGKPEASRFCLALKSNNARSQWERVLAARRVHKYFRAEALSFLSTILRPLAGLGGCHCHCHGDTSPSPCSNTQLTFWNQRACSQYCTPAGVRARSIFSSVHRVACNEWLEKRIVASAGLGGGESTSSFEIEALLLHLTILRPLAKSATIN